jgi:hypothetical protein
MLTGFVLAAFVVAGLVGIYLAAYADGRPLRVRRRRWRGRPALHPGLRRR